MSVAYRMLRLWDKTRQQARDLQHHLMYEELRRRGEEMLQIAADLEALADATPARKLRRATAVLKEQGTHISEMADGMLRPFMLFVVGMGKYGKSTLINSIVGERVAEMDFLPKTWKIDIYSAAQEPGRVIIKMLDGTEKVLDVAEARRFLAEEEEQRLASEEALDRRFMQEAKQLRTVEEKEELRELLRRRLLYESPVSEVHWPSPASQLLRRFDIVDTPGLVQTLKQETLNDLRAYYHKADGVLWLLDANVVAAKGPRQLLDELDASLASVGGNTDNIVAVINRMDQISDVTARAKVLAEARKVYAGRFREILPFSALQALQGVEEEDPVKLEESGYHSLVRAIERHFLSRAIQLRATTRSTGLQSYVHDAVVKTADFARELEADVRRRVDKKATLEKAVSQLRQDLVAEVEQALSSYGSDVQANVAALTPQLFALNSQEERDTYVRERVFVIDDLERTTGFLDQTIRSRTGALFSREYKEAIFTEFRYLSLEQLPATLQPNYAAPDIAKADIDTFYGQALSGLAAGGLALALLGPIAALIGMLALTPFGKWLVVQARLPGLQKRLQREAAMLQNEIETAFVKAIHQICDFLLEQVGAAREESFAALYGPSEHVDQVLQRWAEVEKLSAQPQCQVDLAKVITGRYGNAANVDGKSA